MKSGVRALGVAESYRGDASTLAGAVTRASRVVDGFVFGSCTVGGTDATDTVVDLVTRLDREDVRYVLLAGLALSWYNVLDLNRIQAAVERPVLSVTFEESDGLEEALDAEFSGEELARRRDVYRDQPPRRELAVNDQTVFVRSVGMDEREADDVVRAFTPEGGRPEPLRVARLAARAADEWRDA
ncbi:endonuclease dU [Halomicrococcus sp. SG-WS-1]|uniref:endonuclease dU n=1 Tax=Halomicrococcus sp. SG-WS-1 TaxID=3439057 RepID=UPI003F78CE87